MDRCQLTQHNKQNAWIRLRGSHLACCSLSPFLNYRLSLRSSSRAW